MWITRLELENVKSYDNCTDIVFARGVNAISGPNGAGKSTLLEAIGFALFDSLPYTQAEFLRQGAKRGSVAVYFEDALDEREYVLERPLGGGKISIVDPEVNREVASGRDDVVDWLKDHLGVEPTADLRALFEDAIGVPQGLLTAAFLENAATRKKKFDPLLQVDDYLMVWNQLRDSMRYLREALQTQEQLIAGLQGELKRLPTLQKETEQIRRDTSQDEKDLKGLIKRLDSVSTKISDFETKRKQIEDLTVWVRTLDARIEGLAMQVADAAEAVKAAQDAQDVLVETRPAFEAYEAAQEELAALEDRRKERDNLRETLASVQKDLARTRAEVEALERSMGEIEAAETDLLKLAPDMARQDQLEGQLAEAVEDKTRLDLVQERWNDETLALERLQARLDEVEKGLKRRTELEKDEQKLKKQVKSLEVDSTRLEAELAVAERQRAQITNRLSILETAEEAVCPVCRQTLDAAHFEDLNQHYADERAALDTADDMARARAEEVHDALKHLLKDLQAQEAELATLPLPQQGKDLKREIHSLQKQLRKRENEIATLTGARERIKAIESELEGLGDPRTQFKLLQTRAATRAEVEAQFESNVKALAKHEEVAHELQAGLEAFFGLDEAIAASVTKRDENAAAHRRYLENTGTAKSFEARTAKLKDLVAEHEEEQKQKGMLASELDNLKSDYDSAEHEKVKAEHEKLTRDRAALEERLKLIRERLEALEFEMTALGEKEVELKDSQSERDQLGELTEALEFIRKTVRDAGPYVTRALVQTISIEANRIFTEILGDYTTRLNWNDDYSITVEQGGYKRGFSQLSGGEKMAAALAVRLALLREMSQIRVAFFDEPTANLDDERRENLAGQITQITGFNQLFVISHDDTFERETHHVIRVHKEGGVSRVEVG